MLKLFNIHVIDNQESCHHPFFWQKGQEDSKYNIDIQFSKGRDYTQQTSRCNWFCASLKFKSISRCKPQEKVYRLLKRRSPKNIGYFWGQSAKAFTSKACSFVIVTYMWCTAIGSRMDIYQLLKSNKKDLLTKNSYLNVNYHYRAMQQLMPIVPWLIIKDKFRVAVQKAFPILKINNSFSKFWMLGVSKGSLI